MYCKKCGQEINGKFCSHCGTENEITEDSKIDNVEGPLDSTEIPNKNIWKTKYDNKNKPKKPFYKKWWFWVIIVILIIGIGENMGADKEKTNNDKPTTSQIGTQPPSKNNSVDIQQDKQTTPHDESPTKNDMPSIKGSQAYDVIKSIEQKTGIKQPKTTQITNGYSWSGINSQYSYTVNSALNHEISYANFMILNDGDNSFLGFCASMPYAQADNQKAMDWVNQNIGQETNTTIGDAIFTLSNGKQGPTLTIKAIGYDEYLKNSILNAQ